MSFKETIAFAKRLTKWLDEGYEREYGKRGMLTGITAESAPILKLPCVLNCGGTMLFYEVRTGVGEDMAVRPFTACDRCGAKP